MERRVAEGGGGGGGGKGRRRGEREERESERERGLTKGTKGGGTRWWWWLWWGGPHIGTLGIIVAGECFTRAVGTMVHD